MSPETLLAVGMISAAASVVASLQFARWAVLRQDRLDAEVDPHDLPPEVRKMKIDTLLWQREQYVEKLTNYIRLGNDPSEVQESLERVDRALSRLWEKR
jgi:hypothetical protein